MAQQTFNFDLAIAENKELIRQIQEIRKDIVNEPTFTSGDRPSFKYNETEEEMKERESETTLADIMNIDMNKILCNEFISVLFHNILQGYKKAILFNRQFQYPYPYIYLSGGSAYNSFYKYIKIMFPDTPNIEDINIVPHTIDYDITICVNEQNLKYFTNQQFIDFMKHHTNMLYYSFNRYKITDNLPIITEAKAKEHFNKKISPITESKFVALIGKIVLNVVSYINGNKTNYNYRISLPILHKGTIYFHNIVELIITVNEDASKKIGLVTQTQINDNQYHYLPDPTSLIKMSFKSIVNRALVTGNKKNYNKCIKDYYKLNYFINIIRNNPKIVQFFILQNEIDRLYNIFKYIVAVINLCDIPYIYSGNLENDLLVIINNVNNDMIINDAHKRINQNIMEILSKMIKPSPPILGVAIASDAPVDVAAGPAHNFDDLGVAANLPAAAHTPVELVAAANLPAAAHTPVELVADPAHTFVNLDVAAVSQVASDSPVAPRASDNVDAGPVDSPVAAHTPVIDDSVKQPEPKPEKYRPSKEEKEAERIAKQLENKRKEQADRKILESLPQLEENITGALIKSNLSLEKLREESEKMRTVNPKDIDAIKLIINTSESLEEEINMAYDEIKEYEKSLLDIQSKLTTQSAIHILTEKISKVLKIIKTSRDNINTARELFKEIKRIGEGHLGEASAKNAKIILRRGKSQCDPRNWGCSVMNKYLKSEGNVYTNGINLDQVFYKKYLKYKQKYTQLQKLILQNMIKY